MEITTIGLDIAKRIFQAHGADAMGKAGTKVGDLCNELGITRQTLYRHVDPKGFLRLDGEKVLEGKKPLRMSKP